MTLLHFANCAALTYVPLWIVYKSTDLGEGGGVQAMIRAAGCFAASQLATMILLASFIPDMDNKSFDLSQELMQIIIGMLEVVAMSLVYQYLLGAMARNEKVLALGLGWALAESLLMRLFPMWFGARELEFEWTWIAMAIEANLSIAVYVSFARLVSRWHTKNDDLASKATCRQVLGLAALVHGGLGGHASFLDRFSVPVALGTRCVYTALLWFAASMVYNQPNQSRQAKQ